MTVCLFGDLDPSVADFGLLDPHVVLIYLNLISSPLVGMIFMKWNVEVGVNTYLLPISHVILRVSATSKKYGI